MKEKDLKKSLKPLRQIRLTADEKREGRKALMDFMAKHPAQKSPRPFWNFFRARQLTAALLIVTVLGSGTLSYAAEAALPGDLLYPIKTKVNENVVSAITLSPESQDAWDSRRVERRLEEVAQLEEEGRLDETLKTEIATSLNTDYEDEWLEDYEEELEAYFWDDFWEVEEEEWEEELLDWLEEEEDEWFDEDWEEDWEEEEEFWEELEDYLE